MKVRSMRPEEGETPGAIRITRRDFLKIGGTGLAGAALLGTAGCGVFQQGGQQGGGGAGGQNVFTYMLTGDIPDMNPSTTTDLNSFILLNNVMEGLYRIDENEKPQPALAEGVDISDDDLTYTFTLRDGIKWSNGDPITSQDFKWAWLHALNPDTGAQYAYIISTFIKGAAAYNSGDGSAEDVAIETPDDKTLRVTLEAPFPFWLGLTAFQTYFPQNQKFVEQQGDNYAQSADALLYNGPFKMTQFNSATGVTLVKNEDYWDKGNVGVQKVVVRVVKEVDTRVNLYEGGELDFVDGITSEYVDQYRDTPDFHTIVNFATWWLALNFKNEVFQNENIRRAIQMGFDRNALADKILADGSVGAEGLVPHGMAGPGNQTFREAVGPTLPEYDPQQAKELWQKGVEELGQEPALTLLTQDTSAAQDAGTFLQSQFKENLGMNVEINQQPFDRFLELMTDGDFQFSLYGWIADYNDPMTFLDLFLSDSDFNDASYKNARYDQLINSAQTETDEQVRMDKLIEAEKLLVGEDAAIASVYFEGIAYLLRPSIKNYVVHPTGPVELKYVRVG
jgi:oligopeptide transport system substrate-binding protein